MRSTNSFSSSNESGDPPVRQKLSSAFRTLSNTFLIRLYRPASAFVTSNSAFNRSTSCLNFPMTASNLSLKIAFSFVSLLTSIWSRPSESFLRQSSVFFAFNASSCFDLNSSCVLVRSPSFFSDSKIWFVKSSFCDSTLAFELSLAANFSSRFEFLDFSWANALFTSSKSCLSLTFSCRPASSCCCNSAERKYCCIYYKIEIILMASS